MNVKRILAGLLSLALALSVCGCAAEAGNPNAGAPAAASPAVQTPPAEPQAESLPAGTYTGSAPGMYGDVTVEVTLDGNGISSVSVKEQSDTRRIAQAAVEALPQRIVETQSLAVDTVAGATMTSYGILNAAKNVLTDAGIDIARWTEAPEAAEPVQGETEEFDLVIVGAGSAGLGAAIEAGRLNTGASVLVLEKLAYTGGSGALSGSMIVGGGTAWNGMEENVDYSTEEFVDFFKLRASQQDRMPEGMAINEELVAEIGDMSTEFLSYLIEQEIPLRPVMWFATATWAEGRGIAGFVNEKKGNIQDPEAAMTVWGDWFTEHASQFAEIRTNSEVVELVVNGGAVEGVVVQGPDRTYTVKAKKVILACGGLSANTALFRELNSDVPNIDTVFNFACAGDTGDYFALTEGLDVAQTGYGFIAYPGYRAPYGFHTPFGSMAATGFSMWVNNSAQRFTNEKGYYYQVGFRILEQDGGEVYGIADAEHARVSVLEDAVAAGEAYKADSLEKLAALIGVDGAALTATTEQYNADYEAGGDTLFGQQAAQMTPIRTAPFYARKVGVSTLGTMSSLKVNEKCEILNSAGEAIPNLYGSGEVVFGNLFVQEYVASGCAVGCAVYTGAIAAREALGAMVP